SVLRRRSACAPLFPYTTLFRSEGAELAFTYQNDKLKSRVDEAAQACGSNIVLPLDVTDDAQIEDVFVQLGKHWDGLDILVHSVRSEEHTSELQSRENLVCRLLL